MRHKSARKMFQIPEELINGAESDHMPWALCKVDEEGAAYQLAEVGGGSFCVEVKKTTSTYPCCSSMTASLPMQVKDFSETRPAWHFLQEEHCHVFL